MTRIGHGRNGRRRGDGEGEGWKEEEGGVVTEEYGSTKGMKQLMFYEFAIF